MTVDEAVERLELDPQQDWEDMLLDVNVEQCQGCG